MGREVGFYRAPSGRSPVEEFIDSLPAKKAQKVAWVLNVIEELDVVPAQYFQKMEGTEHLWEVRVRTGSDIYRRLGFFDGPILVILASAFQKKSRKAPRREIRLAENRRQDYFKRRKKA